MIRLRINQIGVLVRNPKTYERLHTQLVWVFLKKCFSSDHVPGSLGICKSLLCSSMSLTILRVAELEMSPGIGLFWFCLWKSILIEKNKQGSANKKWQKKKSKFTSENSIRMHQHIFVNCLKKSLGKFYRVLGTNFWMKYKSIQSWKDLFQIFSFGHPLYETHPVLAQFFW